jgi:hypothetical protein
MAFRSSRIGRVCNALAFVHRAAVAIRGAAAHVAALPSGVVERARVRVAVRTNACLPVAEGAKVGRRQIGEPRCRTKRRGILAEALSVGDLHTAQLDHMQDPHAVDPGVGPSIRDGAVVERMQRALSIERSEIRRRENVAR